MLPGLGYNHGPIQILVDDPRLRLAMEAKVRVGWSSIG